MEPVLYQKELYNQKLKINGSIMSNRSSCTSLQNTQSNKDLNHELCMLRSLVKQKDQTIQEMSHTVVRTADRVLNTKEELHINNTGSKLNKLDIDRIGEINVSELSFKAEINHKNQKIKLIEQKLEIMERENKALNDRLKKSQELTENLQLQFTEL